MKKKIIILFATLMVLVIGLCACGQNQPDVPTAEKKDAEEVSDIIENEVVEDTDVYDVGDFTVKIPDGWMVYPQTDVFADKDENEVIPVKTDSIGIIKDGKTQLDAFSKPVVYAYLYNTSAEEQAEISVTGTLASSFYTEVNEMDVTIHDKKCLAYEVKEASFLDETKNYVYQYIFYPVSESSCIHFIIPVDMIDFAGVSYDDADVMEFMTSVTVK